MRTIDKIPVNHQLLEDINYITPEQPVAFYKAELHFHQTDKIPWHWHPALQMILIKEGPVRCHVGEENFILNNGDGVLINMNQLHRYYPLGKNEEQTGEKQGNKKREPKREMEKSDRPNVVKALNIVFLPEFIAAPSSLAYKKYVEPLMMNAGHPCFILRRQIPWQKKILRLYEEAFLMEDEEKKQPCYELQVHERISAMWREIFTHREEFPCRDVTKNKVTSQIRIKQMISYIDQHFHERISLEDIAEAASISKREALRCFRENMGKTPFSYLTEYRVNQGKNKLLSGNDTVLEIALACGFDSASYFNRVFRRYVNMTPLQFRRQMIPSERQENTAEEGKKSHL